MEAAALADEQVLTVGEILAGNVHTDVGRHLSAFLNDGRHNADGLAAGFVNSFRNTRHESQVAAAEDNGMTMMANPVSQFLRHLEVVGVKITVGRTKNTNFHSAKVRLNERKTKFI